MLRKIAGLSTLNELKWKVLFTGFLFLTGCAHFRNSPLNSSDTNGETPLPKSISGSTPSDLNQLSPSVAKITENGEIVIRGIKLKNTKFDYPVVVNSRVEYWVDYFCGRGRPYFTKYLERSEFFIPYIQPLLKQSGLPEDLVYLAMIESGFNNLARSQAKAVGPWQFISPTGKRYGLKVNWWVDERRDIRKSTLAAVGYLKDLYQMFQSWELAAAAYNAGEAKIARAVRRYGVKDFWTISRQRFLKPETRDYVPKIIAAAIIAKNRGQFGFPVTEEKPGTNEVVAGDGEIVKVVKTDKPLDDLENENLKKFDPDKNEVALHQEDELLGDPNLSSSQIPASLLVSNNLVVAETRVQSDKNIPLAKPVPTPHLTKSGQVGGEELAEFEIQSPADLLKIARAAGLSYHTVKSLNPEILRWCTPPKVGAFRIKLPSSVKEKFLATYNHQAFPRKVQFMAYKVRRGETLNKIAHHFGIKVDPMSELNMISPRMPLKHGAMVLLPMPNDRSRTFASLEIRDPAERRSHRRRRTHRSYRSSIKNHDASISSNLEKSTNET